MAEWQRIAELAMMSGCEGQEAMAGRTGQSMAEVPYFWVAGCLLETRLI